jgi:hypothetical protein
MTPALAAAALTALSVAQGHRSESHPELGLQVRISKAYTAIPVQPDEPWIVLQWVRQPETRRNSDADRSPARTALRLVWIDWVPDPAPTTPGSDEPPPTGEGTDDDGDGAADPEPRGTPPLPINSLERYVDQVLAEWRLGAGTPQEVASGYERAEYRLYRGVGNEPLGWLWSWRNARRTILLIGFCHSLDYEDRVKEWRAIATKAELSEPEAVDTSKLELYYARRPELRGAEFRVRRRSQLVHGWKADDTENFLLIYSTKDEALIRTLKRELEAIREHYVRIFPPSSEVTAVSAVRVCKDRAEYLQYAGAGLEGSGGYWNSEAEELVFYDYDDAGERRGAGKANSRIVLYHEAFHQFIHYSCGELPPHSWFNEGNGDYFSGAVFDTSGKVIKIGVNPWRLDTIQQAIREYMHMPWKDIIRFEQSEYYDPKVVHICYAQGWSMTYFLRECREVQRNPEWAAILPTYFETLKTTFASELECLRANRTEEDPEQRSAAGQRARQRAVEAAFEGVDLAAIERAWIDFTSGLKPPK